MKNPIKILLLIFVLLQNCTNYNVCKSTSKGDLEVKLVDLINNIRMERGLDKLEENIILDNLAYEHCRQMKNRERASHLDYEYRSRFVNHFIEKRTYNENVAYVWALDQHIEKVIDVWLKSKSHAANIYGDFELTGVAIYQDQSGGFYITQIFVND
ncbi:MAG: CAP domain-containing protein [Melioribacteraceae bacterium]|nr:CAP domain-containing protein [Melioribacteraceae bacterium]